MTFRMAMIFSILRKLDDGDLKHPIICRDTDFTTALTITTTLEKYAIAVYQNLPNNELKGNKLKFYEALPERFDRRIYLKTALDLDIKEKVADKYIGQFKKLLQHEYNVYTKMVIYGH